MFGKKKKKKKKRNGLVVNVTRLSSGRGILSGFLILQGMRAGIKKKNEYFCRIADFSSQLILIFLLENKN